jgi:hypothetical protein
MCEYHSNNMIHSEFENEKLTSYSWQCSLYYIIKAAKQMMRIKINTRDSNIQMRPIHEYKSDAILRENLDVSLAEFKSAS